MSGGSFIRLDNLEPVSNPSGVFWGVPCSAVKVRRSHLVPKASDSRVPYLAVSEKWAVRLVPASAENKRLARIAYLAARDGSCCVYCGQQLDLAACSIEHVVPTSAGGPDHASNLALACPGCNANAGHLSAAEKIRLAARLQVGTLIAAAAAASLERSTL